MDAVYTAMAALLSLSTSVCVGEASNISARIVGRRGVCTAGSCEILRGIPIAEKTDVLLSHRPSESESRGLRSAFRCGEVSSRRLQDCHANNEGAKRNEKQCAPSP